MNICIACGDAIEVSATTCTAHKCREYEETFKIGAAARLIESKNWSSKVLAAKGSVAQGKRLLESLGLKVVPLESNMEDALNYTLRGTEADAVRKLTEAYGAPRKGTAGSHNPTRYSWKLPGKGYLEVFVDWQGKPSVHIFNTTVVKGKPITPETVLKALPGNCYSILYNLGYHARRDVELAEELDLVETIIQKFVKEGKVYARSYPAEDDIFYRK